MPDQKNGIERMGIVDMVSGTKKDLFTSGHPVIRELRKIPGILMEEDIYKMPSSCISLKDFFARKQMDTCHVDCLILYKIARNVLQIMTGLSRNMIFPGIVGLEDIYVDTKRGDYPVYILHPEKFQLLDFEQDYEWYPEDERIFGEMTLFNRESQLKADTRLIYKILVASVKGNVKIPPKITDADYSELFYKALPDEWKTLFKEEEPAGYVRMQELLEQCIEVDETFAKQAKERLDDKAQKEAGEKQEKVCAVRGKHEKKIVYCMMVLLRTELKESRKMSKLLYQVQDELELEERLSHWDCRQAFVYGDGVVMAREFESYPSGFRCQCQQQIKEYSAGETLIIASNMMGETMTLNPASEFRMYILTDGSLKNDRLFRSALTMLKERKQEGLKLYLISEDGDSCEACQQLARLEEKKESNYGFAGNS